jgi:LacI family transcriptional regulator
MSDIARVLLLVESSRAYGRGCLLGVAGYLRTHAPWRIFHIERGLDQEIGPDIQRWKAQGVIARIESAAMADRLARLRIPVVDLRGSFAIAGIERFDTDPVQCARLAAEHLLGRGFRSLAYCGFDGVDFSDQRGSAFESILHERGMTCARFSPTTDHHAGTLIHESRGEFDIEPIARWLRSLPRPVGIFACNDIRARQIIAACSAASLAVPDEVAVVGVDNDEVLCELSETPLSSIEPDTYRIGYEGAARLDEMMQTRPTTRPESTPPATLIEPRRLVVRRSSDAIAVDDPDLAAALRVIRDRATEGINVSHVLESVTVSRATLERRFQDVLGTTPKKEIDRLRLLRARQLLHETTYPLDRIATMSGFGSAAHLSVVFKQTVGLSPGAFRQQRHG